MKNIVLLIMVLSIFGCATQKAKDMSLENKKQDHNVANFIFSYNEGEQFQGNVEGYADYVNISVGQSFVSGLGEQCKNATVFGINTIEKISACKNKQGIVYIAPRVLKTIPN